MKLVRMIDEYINDRKFSLIYKDSKLDIINYSEVIDFSLSGYRLLKMLREM